MEKRKSHRRATDIPAEVFGPRGQGLPCTIRNYCSGGLFVELVDSGGPGSRGRRPRSRDVIEIRFIRRDQPGSPPYRMTGQVTHVGDNGFGLRFTQRDDGIRIALQAIREASALGKTRSDSSVSPEDSTRMKALLQGHLEDFVGAIEGLSSEFLSRAVYYLDEVGRNSPSAGTRQDHLRACNLLERSGEPIRARWQSELRQRSHRLLGQASTGAPSTSAQEPQEELQLVDKDSFDRWVTISNLVSKTEAAMQRPLYQLEQRLSYLARKPITGQINPVGPNAVVWCLDAALETLALSVEVKRSILHALDETVLSHLGELYDSLNRKLADAGVLQHIDYGAPTSRDEKPGKHHLSQASHRPERPPRSGGLLSVLERVMGIGRRPPPPPEDTAERVSVHKEPYEYQANEVLDALSEIRRSKNLRLLDQVEAVLAKKAPHSGQEAMLSPELGGSIDVVERLVQLFQHDERVPTQIRESVQQLEVPFAKAAVAQPDFLSDPDSPAVQVVNGLDRLATALSAEPANARRASEAWEAIERIGNTLGSDPRPVPEAFAEARETLRPYVNEYDQLFEANVKRVVEVCNGQERLKEASAAVRHAVQQCVGDRPVPRLFNDTLRLGWASLLNLTWLDKGPDSVEWKTGVQALGDLLALFPPPPTPSDADGHPASVTLDAIDKGFAQVPFAQPQQRQLTDRLREALADDAGLWEQLRSDRTALRLDLPKSSTSQAGATQPDSEEQVRLQAWLAPIRALSPGDWLIELRKPDPSRPVSLAWLGPDKNRYVFVDGRGFKAFERSLLALASDLDTGRVSLLEDGRLPLIQRAVQKVLKSTYEHLVYESAHDTLTGLANRRSFESYLARSLELARNDHSRHSVILLDLDRFQLVNDMCGHEGGDQLLKEVANVVGTYLHDGALLARTGDDELGVLVENTTSADAFRVAETQRRAIENLDFRWEGRRVSVTASLGVVSVDEHTESVSQVLNQADAACFLAKDAGRNQVKAFESTDRGVREHQKELEAIERVDDALREGGLRLYAQLIEPIFLDEGLHDHYEILLRVRSGNGEMISPEALILTAERLDRMRLIDRWTIQTAFAWLDENADQADRLGGFSINLSGQSLADPMISDLLLQRLAATPFPTERIAFEITETAMVKNIDDARSLVERIKDQGCQLFLDDFGTGMASYAYLKNFPVDCIKIDGTFVRNIATDDTDLALVRSITEIAHFSDRRVVAEHVESEAILVRLRELGVDFAQGFAIGRPVPLTSLLNS